ncbi:hypothetical protein COV14_02130 [Candidatus Woesearchaeota archaeon CG10_big_fil_rev_8_21_14_0_10_33_12]|nr:MAG: hypothetical protein COV14_02130 [Candidatus Woesearchaeota archaeon CG10_big_fil_rev_8_21_14_0_10_33_12]
MKKENKALIITFFILVGLLLISSPGFLNITGKFLVSIKAVYEKASISISIVDNIPPDIIIYYPLNDTYNYKNNIYLYYSASDQASGIDKVWYNLNNGNNISLTGNITFNVTDEGSHSLYIFANDSSGVLNNTESVTFFINTSLGYEIISDYTGTTTNFDSLSKTEQENISNMTLEHNNYGKILFNEIINISNDGKESGEGSKKVINLSVYTNISFNRIFINTTELPQLNKSATLRLYNLTFANPRVLRDGLLCPSTICTKISYAAGTLTFNVASFSTYSAEETTVTSGTGPGGGEGSAIVKEKVSGFTVDKNLIKFILKQGETKKEFLEIKNTGEKTLNITINLENLKNFVFFPEGVSEYNLKLKAGEKQIIQLIFNINKDQKPGIYPGKIIVKGEDSQNIVTTIVEIESEKPVFDIEIEIPLKFIEIVAGEELLAKINLYNPKGIRLVNVGVDYAIKDLDGKVISTKYETMDIEAKTSFLQSFVIPSDTKPGGYIFYVKVTYNDIVSSSSSLFKVVEKPHVEIPKVTEKYFYMPYLIIAIIVVFVILMFYQYKKLKEKVKEEVEKAVKKEEKVIEKDIKTNIKGDKLTEINELITKLNSCLDENNKKEAIQIYNKITILYKEIPKEYKKEIFNKCQRILKSIRKIEE